MALDRFGRTISYLRISLTDHCNLRCIYCMSEDQTFRPNPELMQDDEIASLTRLFASLGFDKIRRLTRWGKLQEVWDGILAAERAGMRPVKLNAVVVKGYNEDDVVDL